MKSRELFWLSLKVIGLVVLLQGFRNCVEGLLIVTGYATVRLSTPQYWAAWAVIKIIVGAYLMTGGAPLVNMAFPSSAATSNDASETAAPAGTGNAANERALLIDPKVMFGLVVKTVGLVLVLYGVAYVLDAILYAMKTAESRDASGHSWVVFSIGQIGLGLAMLRGLVPVVEFAFPSDAPNAQPTTEENAMSDEKRDASDV